MTLLPPSPWNNPSCHAPLCLYGSQTDCLSFCYCLSDLAHFQVSSPPQIWPSLMSPRSFHAGRNFPTNVSVQLFTPAGSGMIPVGVPCVMACNGWRCNPYQSRIGSPTHDRKPYPSSFQLLPVVGFLLGPLGDPSPSSSLPKFKSGGFCSARHAVPVFKFENLYSSSLHRCLTISGFANSTKAIKRLLWYVGARVLGSALFTLLFTAPPKS